MNNSKETTYWNPKVSALLSILFTSAFGSFVAAKNWKNLGERQSSLLNKTYGWISILTIAVSMLFVITDHPYFMVSPLILLVVWYLSLGKKQIDYFREKNVPGQHRSFLTPILVSIAVAGLICLLPIILYFVFAFLFGVVK